VQGEYDAASLLARLTAATPAFGPVHIEIIRASKEMTSFYVLALKRDQKGVEDALAALGFARPASPSSRIPAEAWSACGAQAAGAGPDRRLRRGNQGLRAHARGNTHVGGLLHMRAEKYGVLERLGQSKHALVLSGYVAHEDAEALESGCTHAST
jgi:V/A-type H+-transporting ATPase subunit I